MFEYEYMQKPTKIPIILAMISVLILFVFIVIAQTPEIPKEKDPFVVIKTILEYSGYISLGAAIIYGIIKKTKYDNLKTALAEEKEVSSSRKNRNEELISTASILTAKMLTAEEAHKVILSEKENNIKLLEDEAKIDLAAQRAITQQALQMKAILGKLREDGKWEGNESQFF